MTEKLPNHIAEYFSNIETDSKLNVSKELFNANKENIDFKTELGLEEIFLLSVMEDVDIDFYTRGLRPVFSDFLMKFKSLRVSFERKGRNEFVNINRGDKDELNPERLSSLKNLFGTSGGGKI